MESFATPPLVSTPDEMSIGDLLADHANRTPDRVLVERLVDGSWRPVTAAEMHATATAIAKGLIASGVGPGDRVAIMARTRAEWTFLDFGIWYAGAVTVPVYETSSPSQTAWILSDSGAVAIVGENAGHIEVITKARKKAPDVAHVWQIEDGALEQLAAAGVDVSDDEVRQRRDAVRLGDLATIIYTSGTTGNPKGAELTHGNFVELTRNAIGALGSEILHETSRTLLFMPLAHVFARFVEVLCIAAGVPQGHTPDTKTLMADIATFRPTFILSVPRVFEKVYNSSEAKAAAGGKVKIFHWAARAAIEYSRSLDQGGPSLGLRLQHRLADKLVLHKIRDALGGQATFAISGGAPLGERLGHFFRGVGLTVLEGYGLTETTAPLTVNVPAKSKIGTVGPPLPGTSLKIDADGEILAQGVGVFAAYRGNAEATAAAIVDGWFHTGDIGELDDEGYLRITGRKKELIVTAGGKNVVPSQLEDRLRSHPLISQCVVVGDQRPFVAALITLDAEMLPAWLSNHGLPEMGVEEAAKHPEVLAALQRAVDRTNKKFSRAESIRKFEVLTDDFTIDNDYLTPSLKVKRSKVLADYAATVEELYSRAAADRNAESPAV
ncbi:MAG TPA: long-chain fatty acid--CoA ligase [Actinotalea caeni]|uniref:AMP-dependent synthetase/ligase n=1 Tax=Actinotalea caeni TaxID=1348467 RepID=UPI0012E154D2|nr:AMP-dependent synthetase/ligase [Actinotalea caeni]HLV55469.1 long-chain fatty acid--CoA ligase [Actinotalea caeni]